MAKKDPISITLCIEGCYRLSLYVETNHFCACFVLSGDKRYDVASLGRICRALASKVFSLALRIRQFPEFHRFNVEIVCLQRHDRHSQASNYGYHIVVNWANHWIEAQERISLLQSLPLSILILAVYVEYLDELFKLQVTLSAEHIDKVVQATAAVHYMGGHHLR